MKQLDVDQIQMYKETAQELSGSNRRCFQAKITKTYLGGKPWKAERVFGWGREAVALGLKELEAGYICYVEIHERGNNKTEDRLPNLEQDIKDIVEPQVQVDPKFKTPLKYTRATAKAVRKVLIDVKGYSDEELPTVRTISTILNRLGYTLKRVQKTKPLKKLKKQMPFSKMSIRSINWLMKIQKH